ncbi:MAG: thrombospondin type 3 repeat-containing protein [Candidatus Gracilibacteria bacterium]
MTKYTYKKSAIRAVSIVLAFVLIIINASPTVYASSLSLDEYYTHLTKSIDDADHDGLTNLQEADLGTSSEEKDTDQDGYSDGEEFYEFGTDPTKYDSALFSNKDIKDPLNIRLVSLPEEASVKGTSVYVKGLYGIPESQVVLAFESESGLAFNVPLHSDKRGVFHEVVSLDGFCMHEQNMKFNILFKSITLSTIELQCMPESYRNLLSSIEFNNQSVSPGFDMQPLLVLNHLEHGFKGQLTQELEAKGYFSSIVTSAQILSDTAMRTIVASPTVPLEEGNHEFILTLKEPVNDTFYDPLVIPFEVVYDKWGYLKSHMYAGGYASALAMIISTVGVFRIRKLRKRKKTRVYDRDY